MKYVYHWCNYTTPKTEVFEMSIGTKFGIMSIKAMKMDRGGTRVYTGYDIATWDENLTGIDFWEHRYIDAICKHDGNDSYTADRDTADRDTAESFIQNSVNIPEPVRRAILNALDRDEGAHNHMKMLEGQIEGTPSAKKIDVNSKAAAKKEVERKERAHVAEVAAANHKNMLERDTSWGMF